MPDTLYEALTRDDLLSVLTTGERSFEPVVHAKAFGAKGDGSNDDTAAIQAAVDSVTAYLRSPYQRPRVLLGAGRFRTTDTIHLGYGDGGFGSVVLEGEGYMQSAEHPFAGTSIVPDKHDRPAINVQGARGSVIRGISIRGKLGDWIQAQKLAHYDGAVAGVDDTVESAWDDPAMGGASLDSRYAPYAAITIDAYSGTRPATSYPDVVYPPENSQTQYGKVASSDVLIEDCEISGFTVGVAIQPCDEDANGDFVVLRRVGISYGKWGVSIGNTQARNSGLYNVKWNRMFTMMTNKRHGRQNGRFGNAVVDCSGGETINIFDFNSAASTGSMTFISCYVESHWRLGDIQSGFVAELPIGFIGCNFNFELANDVRGYPATVIDGVNLPTGIRFDGCGFNNFKSVVVINQKQVEYDRCVFIPSNNAAGRTEDYQKFAHNFLGGGLVTHKLIRPANSALKVTGFNFSVGSWGSNAGSTALLSNSSREYCIPSVTRFATPVNDDLLFRVPYSVTELTTGQFSVIDLTDLTLTLTFSSWPDWAFMQNGPLPGDVIFEALSKSVFFVRSRTGTTVLAELQNNYRPDGLGGYTYFNTFDTGNVQLFVGNSRMYTPTNYLRGDLTATNAVIANCARDDGQDFVAADILAGDAMVVRENSDSWTTRDKSIISAKDASAQTITLSAGVARTQTRRHLDFFYRLPPANV